MSGSVGQWNRHPEGGAKPVAGNEIEGASMDLGDFSSDGQTEPGSTGVGVS